MSQFPTTLPPDPYEIADYIRGWLGNLSESVMGCEDMLDIVESNITKYVDDLCKITYYSTVDTLNWLIRQQSSKNGESGSSGDVSKRREKNGRREIEVTYSDQGDSKVGWDKTLNDLLSDPTLIGCDPFSDVLDEDKIDAPIIGGADINGYEESFRTRNKFGRAIKENRFGYRRSNYGRRLF